MVRQEMKEVYGTENYNTMDKVERIITYLLDKTYFTTDGTESLDKIRKAFSKILEVAE